MDASDGNPALASMTQGEVAVLYDHIATLIDPNSKMETMINELKARGRENEIGPKIMEMFSAKEKAEAAASLTARDSKDSTSLQTPDPKQPSSTPDTGASPQ